MKNLYTSVGQIADRYNVSSATIWRWVRTGQFPKPVTLSPGCTRWKLSDIQAWEAAQEQAA